MNGIDTNELKPGGFKIFKGQTLVEAKNPESRRQSNNDFSNGNFFDQITFHYILWEGNAKNTLPY